MHSVISQGRVEGIVHSKPADRTALIEEAAGLTKHRKRRHRAQLKLARTQDNLDRALDVEREARSRLRPLKRQAEAAELHARLERQGLELRGRLTRESLRLVREELSAAEAAATEARAGATSWRPSRVPSPIAASRPSATLLSTATTASSCRRACMRRVSRQSGSRSGSSRCAPPRRPSPAGCSGHGACWSSRAPRKRPVAERSPSSRPSWSSSSVSATPAWPRSWRTWRPSAVRRMRTVPGLRVKATPGPPSSRQAEAAVAQARQRLRDTSDREQAAARAQAGLEVELERLIARQRLSGAGTGPSLADAIQVDDGYEAAAAAALGGRLSAQLAEDLPGAARTVAGRGDQGGRALVMGGAVPRNSGRPPQPGARRLLDHLHADDGIRDCSCGCLPTPGSSTASRACRTISKASRSRSRARRTTAPCASYGASRPAAPRSACRAWAT